MTKKKESVIIYNEKSSGFKQIHADGAFGGVTPSGYINLNFYSQRTAIPKGTEFGLTSNGNIGKAIKNLEDSKEGIIREFEIGVYMDAQTAQSLIDFLTSKLQEREELLNPKK